MKNLDDSAIAPLLNASSPPPHLLEGQCQSYEAINSADPCVIIQGPPGTGKTHVACEALSSRNQTLMGDKPHEVWVIATMTCRGAVTIANALLAKQTPNFKLVVSENFYEHNVEVEKLHRFLPGNNLWRPGNDRNESLRKKQAPDHLYWTRMKNSRILVMTVHTSLVDTNN